MAQNNSDLWVENVSIKVNGRPNVLNFNQNEWAQYKRQGQIHAQIYPVTVTGLLPPYQPIVNVIESDSNNLLKIILDPLIAGVSGIKNFDQVLESLGLHYYPKIEDSGVYSVAYPDGIRPDHRMGFGLIERDGASGFTFSCAACHSGQLFGKVVLGLTNRFPTANDFFVKAKKLAPAVSLNLFQSISNATDSEVDLMAEVKKNVKRVGVKNPIVLGLDTSLAQVALSLNRRSKDLYASPSDFFQWQPRSDRLDSEPADSKPAVWWNVKYKNRWLSDGSVVSGNPIFTNIIWNEIGRGVDLKILENWLRSNPKIIDELTTAVFSSEAPLYTDFFSISEAELIQAQKGEVLFKNHCSRCHGTYEKNWSNPESFNWSVAQRFQTSNVIPLTQTPVFDVGTDPLRYQGMSSLLQLNELSISKSNNIVIKYQKGYVPPPLVGIWARWPYFHNNSAPSLCAVLTKSSERPKIYWAGEAINPQTDFDQECNGYPLNEKVPTAWRKDKKFLYDTTQKGLGNKGHDEEIFLDQGQEIFSKADKINLIKFLQSL